MLSLLALTSCSFCALSGSYQGFLDFDSTNCLISTVFFFMLRYFCVKRKYYFPSLTLLPLYLSGRSHACVETFFSSLNNILCSVLVLAFFPNSEGILSIQEIIWTSKLPKGAYHTYFSVSARSAISSAIKCTIVSQNFIYRCLYHYF